MIESALSALKYANEKEDIAGLDRSMEDLNTAWNNASEDIYKASQSAGNSGQAGNNQANEGQSPGGHTEDVTDVPFEEVK